MIILFQELEEIYTDLCSSVSDSILQGAEVVSSRVSCFPVLFIEYNIYIRYKHFLKDY